MTLTTPSVQVDEAWAAYVALLRQHAPRASTNLAPGAAESTLTQLQHDIGRELPVELLTLLRRNDGQLDPNVHVFPGGLQFLSCREIAREWQSWADFRARETEDGLGMLDNHVVALDPCVHDVYTHPDWLPFLKLGDRADYLGVDLAPAHGGKVGQIINFGRDEDRRFVVCETLVALLQLWSTRFAEVARLLQRSNLDALNGIAILEKWSEARRRQ